MNESNEKNVDLAISKLLYWILKTEKLSLK